MNKFVLITFTVVLFGCNTNDFKIKNEIKLYEIDKYIENKIINEYTNKLSGIDWDLRSQKSSKKEAVHYLIESINLFDSKLCQTNPYSDIIISDFEKVYKLLVRVESAMQKSEHVYFYVFQNKDDYDEIHVEIRSKGNNKFTILCGVPIPS